MGNCLQCRYNRKVTRIANRKRASWPRNEPVPFPVIWRTRPEKASPKGERIFPLPSANVSLEQSPREKKQSPKAKHSPRTMLSKSPRNISPTHALAIRNLALKKLVVDECDTEGLPTTRKHYVPAPKSLPPLRVRRLVVSVQDIPKLRALEVQEHHSPPPIQIFVSPPPEEPPPVSA